MHRPHPLEQLEPRLALAGLVISNPSVNEASPYAMFMVKGTANEAISLSVGGTATGGGVDYGPGLEWTTDGTTWISYASGEINLSAGDGEAFVRLPIVNDTPFDNGETIVLTVTPTVGSAATGTATIYDDGTGNTYDGTVGGAPLDASALSVEEWRRLSSEKSRLMMASFHGAFYKSATGGFYVAGELASPTGLNQTVPVLVTPANGYTITGDIIDIALAGNNGTSQYAVLTTDGLWAWGYEGTLLPDDLTPSRAISSIALPSDFDPRDAVSMSASVGGILFLMRDGTVRSVVTNTDGESTPRASSHAAGDHFAKVRLGSVTGGILTGITDIEYGPNSAFVYSKNANKFYGWGSRSYSGNGSAGPAGNEFAFEMVNPLPAGVEVIQLGITAGTLFVLASNGRIYTLGENTSGPGGQGNQTEIRSWATVKNQDGSGPLENVQFISAQNHANSYPAIAAITRDGSLLAWGANNVGMLAIPGGYSYLPKPTEGSTAGVQVYAVETGGHFSLALNYGCEGQINATGHNPGGAFGDGTTGNRTQYAENLFLGNILGACAMPVASSVIGTNEADDDRPTLSIDDVTASEAAGTMSFTVTLSEASSTSTTVNYATANGTATAGSDYTAKTGAVSFAPGETSKTITVAINSDLSNELPESFFVNLFGSVGARIADSQGVGTITDDGAAVGRNPLVNSITVNEGSPYAVFTVTGKAGAGVTLLLGTTADTTDVNATSGTDYNAALEYYDPTFNSGSGGWRAYSAAVPIPADGTLLVRNAITNDATFEGPENYTLKATYNGTGGGTNGGNSTGIATIIDNGTGSLFSNANTTGIPDAPGSNGAPATLNDDRLVTITGFSVNEASPYGIFTVTGAAGQSVKLVPTDGTAKVASGTPPTDGTVDYGPGLQYFDGTTWQDYTPDSFVQIPVSGTTLLVRTAIVNDTLYELSEAFTLTASNTQGATATATGTVTDDGTGSLFSATNTTGVPDAPGVNGAPATLNDDRPDSDGDGIRDYIDIDDDNDGVTDCHESVTVPLDFTGVGSNIVNRNVDPTGYTQFSVTKVTTTGMLNNPNGDSSGMFATSVKGGIGNTAQYRMDFTRPTGLVIRNNLAHAGGGGGYITYGEEYTFAASGTPDATIALNDPAGELQIWNGTAWVGVPANYTATTIRWRLNQSIGTLLYGLGSFTFHATDVTSLTYTQVNQSNPDNGASFNIYANCVDIDTDGDGTPNRLDTNSDADTCSDASEAGTSTVPGATTIPGPYGADGWADSVQAAGTTALPVTFTITTNTLSSASAGNSATTSQGVGAMSGKIMNGAVEVGQWYLANLRYTKKAVSTTNGITGSTFTSATAGNPYGVGGVGVLITAGEEPTGVVSFSYDVRVTMNPGYRAESIYLLGRDPNSATGYGPAIGTTGTIPAPGGMIRASGFVDGTGTVSDPNNNLVAADGLTFTAGTNLQGYTGVKLPADTNWSLTVPSAHPVTYLVDFSGTGSSSANEATAFSVRVVEDLYGEKALDPAVSECGGEAPAVAITSVEVNESSPFAIVQVSLSEALTSDITFTPSLASGSGTVGTDTGVTPSNAEIEYFDGSAWVSAAGGVTIPAGATSVLLRTAITPDTSSEGSEIVDIATGAITGGVVSNATGVTGTITIRDDAAGSLFGSSNSSGTSDTPGINGLPANLDDDRPLAVNDITVNEASPYGVFTVTGQPGQLVALALGNTTSGGDADALLGTDTGDAGSGVPLQVFNGTDWVDYAPGSFVAIPTGGTKLLARTKITNDSPAVYEGPETFTLTATNVGGTPDTGVGTILDDGTGDIFPNNTTGNPDENAPRDDDRGLQIGDVTVNEGSPYAVFRLENPGSSPIDLASLAITAPGSGAVADLGSNPTLDIFDPAANSGAGGWVPFAAGTDVPAGGELLVRVGITAENDSPYEGPEKFVLSAGITAGPTFSGTGTILDDGKGDIFPDNTAGNPDENAPKDDDRTLQIDDVTVNEASPYAVFRVGNPGLAAIDLATLAVVDPSTGVAADLGPDPAVEIFDPAAADGAGGWVPFTPGTDVPAGGELLVRVGIAAENDSPYEGPEKFLLSAGISAGPTFSGVGTILDDGNGDIFPDDTTGNPDENAPKDDDRTLQIGDVTVNEASPYAVFRLTNPGSLPIDLAGLAIIDPNTGAAADLGADPSLEIFDPAANDGLGAWVPFTVGTDVPANGELLVRVGITAEQDAPFEGPEKFVLAATIADGLTSYGTGTILDNGTGDIFPDNTTGNPDENAPKNDDRTLQIDDVTVNEASPYAVFRLENPGASPIDLAALAIIDPTTGVAADLGANPSLEVYDGTAWVPFDPSIHDVPANGELLVRVGITAEQDAPFEGPEKFVLAATITSGPTSYGTGTILDNGTGDIFPDNPTGNPDENAPKDDDRSLQVNDVTVNEGSPYAVFRIENPSGQPVDLGSLAIIDPNTGVAADLGPNPPLEIFDPAANSDAGDWVPFAAGTEVPANGELLVRVGVTAERDAAFEGPEKFVLAAGILNGPTSYGTGTILDDGLGEYFPDSPTGQPDPTAPKDDDRTLQIDDVTVNEASPYAIFHLTNPGSSPIDLAALAVIDPNTGVAAELGSNPTLEVFDPTVNGGAGAWVAFAAGTDVPANGELLVRVGITAEDDMPFEGPEKFVLAATITSGPTSYGIGTILDNGTGDLFGPSNTSGAPDTPGTDGLSPALDDDRTLQIDDVTINEGSPYAIFRLTNPGSSPIDLATLAVIDPNTGVAADLGSSPTLEIWDGADWVTFDPVIHEVPPSGELLVRVGTAAEQDAPFEGPEKFVLAATITNGPTSYGIGTILDDGAGDLFGPSNTTGTPDAPGIDGLPAQTDDDRPLTVNDITVNEGSPYAMFTVTGVPGQRVALALGMTTDPNDVDATLDADTADAGDGVPVQYFDGTAWVDYAPGAFVPMPTGSSTLLVRTKVTNDSPAVFEGPETFVLTATTAAGKTATGMCTILDTGLGDLFSGSNTSGTPDAPTSQSDLPAALDDDRPAISVSDVTVNEATDGFAEVTVTLSRASISDTTFTPLLASGSATVGTDTTATPSGAAIEYFDGEEWLSAAGGVTIPAGATSVKLRSAIAQDSNVETTEDYTITTGPVGGDVTNPTGVTGTVTIVESPSIAVSSVTVNEGSPFAIVEVTLSGTSEQPISFTPSLVSDSATAGVDTKSTPSGAAIEYFDGTNWVSAAAGATIPAGQTSLLLRVAVKADTDSEDLEELTIATGPITAGTVLNPTGTSGTIGIRDDAEGDLFGGENTTGSHDHLGDAADLPAYLDDDRPLAVNSISVNEGTPFAVFTVTGQPGQLVSLALGNTASTTDRDAVLGTDTGDAGSAVPLQYFNGADWLDYTPGSFVEIPSTGTTLLVRTAITNDSPPVFEGPETFTLTATNTGGAPATGVGTILDNWTGDLFGGTNTSGLPDTPGTDGLPVNLDDDRPSFSVNDVTVNETDGTITFTVTLTGSSVANVTVDYATADGTATLADSDYTSISGTLTFMPGETTKTVTLPILNNTIYEGPETLALALSNASGGAVIDDATGVGTINDAEDMPTVSITDVQVIEATDQYAVMTVSLSAAAAVPVSFTPSLANAGSDDGYAVVGTDTQNAPSGAAIEYFNGTSWVSAASGVTIPAGQTSVQLRSAIKMDDGIGEPIETYSVLTNTVTFGTGGTAVTAAGVTGTVTIVDNPTMSISSVTVNEASRYAVVAVSLSLPATSAITFTPSLANGTPGGGSGSGTAGTDTGSGIEYFNGTAWVSAAGGVTIPVGNTGVLLRAAINQDTDSEISEVVAISTGPATNVLNPSGVTGTITIKDDSTGSLFSALNSTATPDAPGTNGLPQYLDDDRPLAVNSISVNEGTPFAVFTVTGQPGQLVSLALGNTASTTDRDATLGTDTANAGSGVPLQVYNGTAWVDYAPGSFVAIPATGTTLLVRTRITNDSPPVFEGPETFTLTATNTGTTSATGVCTVLDDESGDLFSGTNTSGLPEAPGTNGLPANLDDDRPYDLSVTVTDGRSSYTAGSDAVYTITVMNTGPGTVTSARVLSTLPTAMRSARWTATYSPNATGPSQGTHTATHGIDTNVTLPSGESVTFSLVGPISSDAVSLLAKAVSVEGSDPVRELNPGDNASSDTNYRPLMSVGTDVDCDGSPIVVTMDPTTGAELGQFLAFEQGFRGGVRTVIADVNHDGTPDVLAAPGLGRSGEIRVFSLGGQLLPFGFMPYGPGFLGGINLDVGDVDGDGIDDLVTAEARGAGRVAVFRGLGSGGWNTSPMMLFNPFGDGFRQGVSVALADVGTFQGGSLTDGNAADGKHEIVVGTGAGTAPVVRVFDVSARPQSVRTINPLTSAFRGGVTVSTGRYDADPTDDVIVSGGRQTGAQTQVFSGKPGAAATPLATYSAFAAQGESNAPTYSTGIDTNGDGRIDSVLSLQGAGAGGGVRVVNRTTGEVTNTVTLLRTPLHRASVSSGSQSSQTWGPTRVPLVTTATGLQILDLVVGQGGSPAIGSSVTMHVIGSAQNGAVFANTRTSGVPLTITLQEGATSSDGEITLVRGLIEAVLSMKAGGRRMAYVPAQLAFGDSPADPDDPAGMLVFDIELVST